jgi:hypothetical protein
MISILGLVIVVFSWTGMARSGSPLTVVDTVNLDRYPGKWYEIARNPSWLQKGCTVSAAEYQYVAVPVHPNIPIIILSNLHEVPCLSVSEGYYGKPG